MIYYRKPASKSIAGDGIRISKPVTPENLAGKTEDSQQMALFCWAALPETLAKYPQVKWMFAIPNGFYSTPGQKAKMKAEGLRSGVPDIFLPVFSYSYDKMLHYYGLFIEMKVGKNVASEEQLEWLAYLNEVGYKAIICYSWQEAVTAIKEYLDG
jgi:hypothetical protein